MLSIIKTIALAGLLATPSTGTIVPKWMHSETACEKIKRFDDNLNKEIKSMEHCVDLLDKFMPDNQCDDNNISSAILMQDVIKCTQIVALKVITITTDNILGRIKSQPECIEINKKLNSVEVGSEEYCAAHLSYAKGYCFKYQCVK